LDRLPDINKPPTRQGRAVVREEAIPILRVRDAAGAVAWYGRLGFAKEWEHRFAPNLPAFVTVARGEAHLFLSEHKGDARLRPRRGRGRRGGRVRRSGGRGAVGAGDRAHRPRRQQAAGGDPQRLTGGDGPRGQAKSRHASPTSWRGLHVSPIYESFLHDAEWSSLVVR
jgi:hypothetical protein